MSITERLALVAHMVLQTEEFTHRDRSQACPCQPRKNLGHRMCRRTHPTRAARTRRIQYHMSRCGRVSHRWRRSRVVRVHIAVDHVMRRDHLTIVHVNANHKCSLTLVSCIVLPTPY